MRCPTLAELLPPPPGKTGWPWTEESDQLPDEMPAQPEVEGMAEDGSSFVVRRSSDAVQHPSSRAWPRISIVTPSYNQGQFIEETIRSVLLQGYPNLEYMVIDGGSTDESVEIIKKYEPWLTYWVSEPDEGQTYAIRKGMDRATGDFVNWLNSDDYLLPGALRALAESWRAEGRGSGDDLGVYCGGALHVNVAGEQLRESQVKAVDKKDRLFPTAPPLVGGIQASCFVTRQAWQQVGGIDVRLKYTMDTDLYHRCYLRGARFVPIGRTLAAYRQHPNTKTLGGWQESIAYKKHFYALRLLQTPEAEKEHYRDRIHRFWYGLYLRSITPEDSIGLRGWKAWLGVREYPRCMLQSYRLKRIVRLVLYGS